MNNYDKILKRFTGDDNDPAWCEKPFKHGNTIIATDRYILIRIDADKCEGEYGTHPNQPTPENIDKLFPQSNCDLIINVHEMAKLINSVDEEITIAVTGEDAECPECGGRGTVEWEYESNNGTRYGDFDCPECNGKGHVTHRTYTREQRNININGADFNIGIIMEILESIHQLGHETAHIVAHHEFQTMLISVEPGVDIIAVPNGLGKPAVSITLKSSDK